MNKILADAPAVKLAIPILLGGYWGWYFPFDFPFMWIALALLIAGLVYTHHKSKYKQRWIFGFVTALYCLVAGYSLTQEAIKSSFVTPPAACKAVVVVNNVKQKAANKWQCDAEFLTVFDSLDTAKPYSGNVRILLMNYRTTITPGDTLLVNGEFKSPINFMPPSDFNYVAYLKSIGIGIVAYVDGGHCKIIGKGSTTGFWAFSRYLNKLFTERIENSPLQSEVKGIMRAFIIGDKSRVGEDVRNDVAVSGLLHILTVSGLHTGIVFFVFSFLFKSVRKRKVGLIIYGFVSIFALWLYAAITGLAPSVCRAALMFTVMIFGQCLGRKSLSINSVAVAAVILFVNNPIIIEGLSFKLSFAAVTGIILANPLLLYLRTSSRILNFFIPIGFISLVATLSTLPLVLYHFGQFPTYFMLSNLVVLPFMPLIMYGGFMAVIFNFPLLWQLLDWGISLFLKFVNWIAFLPWAHITHIDISWISAICIAMAVLLLINWLLQKKAIWLIGTLFFLLGFEVADMIYCINKPSASLCVYNSKGNGHIELRTINNTSDISPLVVEAETAIPVVSKSYYQGVVLYDIENKRVAVSSHVPDIRMPLDDIDLLVIEDLYFTLKIRQQFARFKGMIVACKEGYGSKAVKEEMGIKFYSIKENGALEIPFY